MKTSVHLLLVLTLTSAVIAREPFIPTLDEAAEDSTTPNYLERTHSVGRLSLGVSNYGSFGPAEYPRNSYKLYLREGGIWVGGILAGDTLVSTGAGLRSREFNPDGDSDGDIVYRSTIDPSRPWYEGAISHQDFIAVYSDTCQTCPELRADEVDDRYHRPLHIQVTQRSFAWAYDYSQDIVLLEYAVKNIGSERLRQLYVGFYFDGDVFSMLPSSDDLLSDDDLVGFIDKYPASYLPDRCYPDSDQVNLGWTADNEGNLWRPQTEIQVEDIIGLSLVGAQCDFPTLSFNWWGISYQGNWIDYGPQARATYRPMPITSWGTELGGPKGDRARYHYLRNGERDFDQAMLSTVAGLNADWVLPPEEWLDAIYSHFDPRFLMSVGSFGLDPGQSISITVACVAGTRFHRYRYNGDLLPYNPYGWYERVRFDNLVQNALWAKWIYDNPGVDTDGDGYAGDFQVCDRYQDSIWYCDTLLDSSANPDSSYVLCRWEYVKPDTVWRSGDGVPDFRGAFPPPNPSTYFFVNQHGDTLHGLRVYPDVGKIRVVWNGVFTENDPDPFWHRNDFEGYHVYVARDERPSSYSLVTSYDLENWSLWEWNQSTRRFVCRPTPLILQELRCRYAESCGDTTWFPEQYSKDNPLFIPGGPKGSDQVLYFEPMGDNRSILANDPVNANTGIRKLYPHAPKPAVSAADLNDLQFQDRSDTTYFTAEGFLKYYEYEYTIEGVLPTVVYYVNVTAFDHGYPGIGLSGLEGDPSQFAQAVFPLPSSDVIAEEGLDVFVFPNPYRLDADYRELGYEAILRWQVPEDKTRLIHFANLPPKCTIRIFSLDGDLIRELDHDSDPGDYTANHDTWDLINRSLQLVVSGLYYWTVEDDRGNVQTGKLVIIM